MQRQRAQHQVGGRAEWAAGGRVGVPARVDTIEPPLPPPPSPPPRARCAVRCGLRSARTQSTAWGRRGLGRSLTAVGRARLRARSPLACMAAESGGASLLPAPPCSRAQGTARHRAMHAHARLPVRLQALARAWPGAAWPRCTRWCLCPTFQPPRPKSAAASWAWVAAARRSRRRTRQPRTRCGLRRPRRPRVRVARAAAAASPHAAFPCLLEPSASACDC